MYKSGYKSLLVYKVYSLKIHTFNLLLRLIFKKKTIR